MIRRRFDLTGFVHDLGTVPAGEMAAHTEREMASLHGIQERDPHLTFQRALYARKLERLLDFLKTRHIPSDLTPKERAAYHQLGERLAQMGSVPRELVGAL